MRPRLLIMGGASIQKSVSYVKRSAVPRKTHLRETGGYIGKKMGIVKARFSAVAGVHPSRVQAYVLIQKFVPIIPPPRFVAGTKNERFDLLRVQSECCPGAAHHILFHHH